MNLIERLVRSPFFIIAAAVVAVFGWSISFGFLYYDDHFHIFENQPLLNGHVLYFWKNAYEGLYIPLVYTAWSFLYKVFGLNPAIYHGITVLFHILNAMLVYTIAVNFKLSKQSSLIGALLFAVHPFQVESVAWVSCFKDTSYGFFSLLAIWIFLFSSKGILFKWCLGFVTVCAAILCKPTAVVLPVFICLYVFITAEGSLSARLQRLFKVVGPLPLSLAVAYFSINMAKASQPWAEHPFAAVSLFERPLIVLDSLGFYLTKLLLPSDFYVDYARYPRNVLDNRLFYLNGAVALIFLSALLYWVFNGEKQRFHAKLFSALLGILVFMPTSGLISFGHQKISTTADRYMYLVLAAVAVAVAVALEKIQNSNKVRQFSKIAVLILVVLGSISFMQSINWRDLTLFTENLYEGNPNNYFANRNLGLINQLKGNNEKALEYFTKANEIDPTHLSAHAAIVSLYFNKGDYSRMDQYIQDHLTDEKLVRLQQTVYETHAFLMAVAESHLDRKAYDKALAYLCRAKSLGIKEFAEDVENKIGYVRIALGNSSLQCASVH